MFEEGALRIRPGTAGVDKGTTGVDIGEESFNMQIKITPTNSPEDMSVTLGHEAFLHGMGMTDVLQNNFKPNMTDKEKKDLRGKFSGGHKDHKDHSTKQGTGSNTFTRFQNYLKGWFLVLLY